MTDAGRGRRPAVSTRRELFGALSAWGFGALAGCSESEPTETRTFRADPVGLADSVAGQLRVETAFEDRMRYERETYVDDERTLIRVFDRGTAHARRREDPTLLESYVDEATANAAPGAVVVPASELGLTADDLTGGLWDGWNLPVERVGLLVPEGARADGDVDLGETMAVAAGDAAGPAEVEVETNVATALFLRPGSFLPREFYLSGEFHVPDAFYLPDGFRTRGGFESGGVLYLDAQARAATLFDRLELPGETVAGETVDLTTTMLAAPGDVVFQHPGGFDPAAVFDLGEPAPLAGREFGVLAMSTPSARISDRSVNPLFDAAPAALLEYGHPRRLLREVGISRADPLEWRRGPTAVDPAWHDPPAGSLLGETVEATAYAGVVSGTNGPHAVVCYAATVDDGDRVLAAGAARRPVGTPDGRSRLVGEEGFIDRERFGRAASTATRALPGIRHDDG